MFNRIPIRMKLTGMTLLILMICCIGLTLITNISANKMSSQIAGVLVPLTKEDSDFKKNKEIKANKIIPSTHAISEMQKLEQNEILNHYYLSSVSYMISIIIIGGMAAYFFSGKVLIGLVELNRNIKESSIDTLSDQIEVPLSNDEISDLTDSFNKMKIQLNDAFIFQKEFSAIMAHELRTPLTVLNTKLVVYKRKNQFLDNNTELLISDLSKQVERLIELVESILQLTKDCLVKETSSVLMTDLIENILMDLSNIIDDKKILVSVWLGNQIIEGDLDLLYRAFYNILENSVKYNKDGGSIIVTSTETNEHSKILITDTGIGIPAKYREDIFKSLYRVDGKAKEAIRGSGLGLAIVKKIIDKHEGKIKIEDNISGKEGSTVTVSLPKRKSS